MNNSVNGNKDSLDDDAKRIRGSIGIGATRPLRQRLQGGRIERPYEKGRHWRDAPYRAPTTSLGRRAFSTTEFARLVFHTLQGREGPQRHRLGVRLRPRLGLRLLHGYLLNLIDAWNPRKCPSVADPSGGNTMSASRTRAGVSTTRRATFAVTSF